MSASRTPRVRVLTSFLVAIVAIALTAVPEATKPTGDIQAARESAIGAWFVEEFGTVEALAPQFNDPREGQGPSGPCGSDPRVADAEKYVSLETPFGNLVLAREPLGPGSTRTIACLADGSSDGDLMFGMFGMPTRISGSLGFQQIASTWRVTVGDDYKAAYDEIAAAMRARPFRPFGVFVGDPNIASVGWALALLYAAGAFLLVRAVREGGDTVPLVFGTRALRRTALVVLALGGWIVLGVLLAAATGSHQIAEPIGLIHGLLEFSAVLALALTIAVSVWRLFVEHIKRPASVS